MFHKAAEQGVIQAQYNLGGMLATGQGVPKNEVEAYKYLTLAASRSDAGAGAIPNRAAQARDILAKRMTPAQIAEAEKLVREQKPTSEK